MKIGNSVPGAKGSFGIPAEIRERGEQLMGRGGEDEEDRRPGFAEPSQRAVKADEDEPAYEGEIPEEAFETKKRTVEEDDKEPTPEENLARIGVELDDDDYHNIVFRGGLEKEVVVFPAISKTRELRAVIKTLKTKEYDSIDEILAEDYKTTAMTNDGVTSRRSLLILSFAVVKLDGKALTKPIFYQDESGKNVVDVKATARDRKEKILGELSPVVVNELISIHAILTINMELILKESKAKYIKKLSPPRKA